MREPRILSPEEMQQWVWDVRWVWAKTMEKNHPHWYTLRREQAEERFVNVVHTVWTTGYDRWYLRRKWRSLDIGEEFFIWVHTEPTSPDMPAPVEQTVLINRAQRVQERLL